LLGVAIAAVAFASVPEAGSAPSIYDEFNWSSIANRYWHLSADGGGASISNGHLRIHGDTVELDRRLQTDPRETVVAVKIRPSQMHRLAFGLGEYRSGSVGLEFDDDGIKCGRQAVQGWRVDFLKAWSKPPLGQWFYLVVKARNPYPRVSNLSVAQTKPISLTCAAYDAHQRLIASVSPSSPPSKVHYAGLDQVYIRTWDSRNDYALDWIYAGPASGSPVK
jgi:hypothetical protein